MSTALAAARAKTRGKRMLREALEGYGEDDFTLSEWNAKKKQAVEQGKWTWKPRVVDTNQAIKARLEKHGDVQDAMNDCFVDISAAMQQEFDQTHLGPGGSALPSQTVILEVCEWSERVGGRHYRCTNAPVKGVKSRQVGDDTGGKVQDETAQQVSGSKATKTKRLCAWHVRECQYKHHPMEHSRAIEVANNQGMCLRCYEVTAATERKTLQRVPPRVVTIKTPGVCLSDEKSTVQHEMLYKAPKAPGVDGGASGPRLTASSICCWQKEHFERAYIWRCSNRVLMHPALRGSFLPFCGFHAPRCIRDYGRKRAGTRATSENCPAIERRNQFGMCHNHLEAQLSEMGFEARGAIVVVESEFDVPGIKECKKEVTVATVTRHPLAPLIPPPNAEPSVHYGNTQAVAVLSKPTPPAGIAAIAAVSIAKFVGLALHVLVQAIYQVLAMILSHPNPASALVKEALWRVQFARRASVVATRIQRIFRGNRARRRVRRIRYESAALRRIAACRTIQRIVRGFLGRRRSAHEAERVDVAVPHLQRMVRGGLARRHCRRLRAVIRLQQNYRWYRQRLLAWGFREEAAYMCSLQREADDNLRVLEQQLAAFRRIRARRVLSRHVERWRHQKEAKHLDAVRRVQTLLSTIKIQRKWRRHCRSTEIQKRYDAAQQIQKRARGWLTRHMWRNDPGVLVIVSFVSALTAFEYGRIVVLPLRQGNQSIGSYSFQTRRVRMTCGAIAVQRVFRGHLGRLRANAVWAAMLKRWEWIGLSSDSTNCSSDSMTLGRERYGFVLPSHGYHWESNQHMRPVVRDAVADRGHAYKYQFILDLIKDRDGKRAWSMEREKKWQRDHRTRQAKLSRHLPESTRISPKGSRTEVAQSPTSTPLAKVLYPVGSLVDVTQIGPRARAQGTDTTRASVTRRGRVVAVNLPLAADQEPTFDIAYNKKDRVDRRVVAARVSHAIFGIDKPLRQPKKPVGAVIQAAIDKLTQEFEAREPLISLATSTCTVSSDDVALPTVEAIADRLGDTQRGRDLLADPRDFVNFVFRNSSLLEQKWLKVVDLVRYSRPALKESESRRRIPVRHQDSIPNQPSERTTHPIITMLCHEFGIQGTASHDIHKPSKTAAMIERGDEIERRLTKLGFRRSANSPAILSDESSQDTSSDQSQSPRRPNTGLLSSDVSKTRSSLSRQALDDLETVISSTNLSSQDIHRFIYELKTLPRLRHREKIIQVTTRNARSFICGHPGCGRCFSSHEAARMHQKTMHEGRERFASANPLTDQYLHSYWPQQTPWTNRDATKALMVGHFVCSQSECRLQFRSRRDLQRHLSDEHDIGIRHKLLPPQPLLTQERTERKLHSAGATILWLGPFVLCRSLGDKLAVPWNRFGPCTVHGARLLDDCAACRLLEQLPVMPARCHLSVAISILPTARCASPEEEKEADDDCDAAFTIFSTEDSSTAVAVEATHVVLVRARDGVVLKSQGIETDGNRLRGSPRRNRERLQWMKKPSQLTSKATQVVFIQSVVLCRDARDEAWVIGRPFVSTQRLEATETAPSTIATPRCERFAARVGDRRYNVELDRSRIVVAPLLATIGAAMVLESRSVSSAEPTSPVDGNIPEDYRIDVSAALPSTESPAAARRDSTTTGTSSWRMFELIYSESNA